MPIRVGRTFSLARRVVRSRGSFVRGERKTMSGKEARDTIRRDVLHLAVLNSTNRSDVRLRDEFEAEKATTGVEGLLSTMLRVKAFYSFDEEEEEERVRSESFIFKKMPATEFQMKFVSERGMFLKEALYYEKVVPLMRRASAGKVEVPVPRCYRATASGGVDDVIVMEDLKADGYRTVDRSHLIRGMDILHCRLAMRCLGKLHGLGMAAEKSLSAESCGWTEVLPILGREGCFFVAGEGCMEAPAGKCTKTAMKTIIELSEEIEGIPKESLDSGMLRKVVDEAWTTFRRLAAPDPEGVNVLSHGDYGITNIMFKYDESGKIPVNAKTIDLQFARYSHPCVDILYFAYLCTRKPLRDAYFDELVNVYYESLKETLEIVGGCEPKISLQELVEDVNGKYKPFGVLIAAVFSPALLLGDDFVPKSYDEMTSEKVEKLFETGNADLVKERFASDMTFRSNMIDIIKEFVEVALPYGPNSLKSSPFIFE